MPGPCPCGNNKWVLSLNGMAFGAVNPPGVVAPTIQISQPAVAIGEFELQVVQHVFNNPQSYDGILEAAKKGLSEAILSLQEKLNGKTTSTAKEPAAPLSIVQGEQTYSEFSSSSLPPPLGPKLELPNLQIEPPILKAEPKTISAVLGYPTPVEEEEEDQWGGQDPELE